MKPTTSSQSDSSFALRNLTRLNRLAAFAPLFRDPSTVFGIQRPDTGTGTRDDPTNLGSYQLSAVGAKFFDMVYDTGWIVRDFDWPDWAWSDEGQLLSTNREALGKADCEQLAKLLTAIVRQDRFYDGALGEAFQSGLLRAIAERAEVIASTAERT